MGGLGGFGALFDPRAAGYSDPVLVAATDGVGTKLKLAGEMDRHDTIGIDLVAMCVNDLVVQGAEPLFFLDYFSTGKLDSSRAEDVVAGIAEGCRIAGCALVGGETAEMPGLYGPGDYDLAGFAIGAVERASIIDGRAIAPGDTIIGLTSSGPHSNGYSLIRNVVETAGIDYASPAEFEDISLGEALLRPTRIYVSSALAAHGAGLVKGFAHITGGGFPENVARILPDGVGASIDAASWPMPPVFGWLMRQGGIPAADMASTFNCGIGMIAVVAAADASEAARMFTETGSPAMVIGEIVARASGDPAVELTGLDEAWRV
jgi:phosphoribosylformylglycinamidine cyclo-ligase